jgi:cytochrome c peroxidase
MNRLTYIVFLIFILVIVLASCKKDRPDLTPLLPCVANCGCGTPDFSNATPFQLDLPSFIPPMQIPSTNPLTVEGIDLGRFLFWDKQLSADNSISCGSCHLPEFGFSDPAQFSTGVGGLMGTRQSMALVNLGWADFFFWDGRASTLERQIFHPVVDPVEMNESWPNVVEKIKADPLYSSKFEAAFGSSCVDSTRISMAIAQFLRTMVSFDSPFDRAFYGPENFTEDQWEGVQLFIREGGDPADGLGGQWGGDCFHCHGGSFNFFTDHQLHNNGLDSEFNDPGAYAVTGNVLDMGRFKTPTLRNIEYTSPYMHDGRFNTLGEVIDHYNTGGQPSATLDPFMKYEQGGLQLTPQRKFQLLEFLKMLSDEEFMSNPAFSDPH